MLPSYTEGFPNVILEAMALRKAIIATNVGAIPEMLEGESGVLIKPQDVNMLATELELLIYDDTRRLKLGQLAYEQARSSFSDDGIFSSLVDIWRTIRD